VEERPLTEENKGQSNQRRTPSRESGPSGLERVRRAAKKKDGKVRFTALLHQVSVDQLRDSYHSLKKKAAPGVDGVRWQAHRVLPPARRLPATGSSGVSRFSRMEFLCVHGVFDSAGHGTLALARTVLLPS